MQEFAQDFAPSPSMTARAAAPRILQSTIAGTSAPRAPILTAQTNNAAQTVIATKRAQEIAARDKRDDLVIGTLSTLSTVGIFATFMGDAITAGLSKLLTIGAKPDSKWKTSVDNVVRGWTRGLRNTETASFINSGGKAYGAAVAQKQAEFLARSGQMDKAAAKLATADKLRAATKAANEAAAAKSSRIGGFLTRQLNKLDNLTWLQKAEKATLGRFFKWRENVNLRKAEAGIAQLDEAIIAPAKKQNIIARKFFNKTDIPAPAHFEKLAEVQAIKSATGNASLLEETAGVLKKNVRGYLAGSGEIAEHMHLRGVGSAARHIRDHAGLSRAYQELHSGGGSMIGKVLKNIPRAMGRASLFHVIAGGAIAIGAVARTMENGKANRKGYEALYDFAADVYGVAPEKVTKAMISGKDAHPLVVQAAEEYGKGKRGRGAYTAISNVAEVANIGTMKAGGEMLMLWYMGGDPMARKAFVSEGDLFTAHTQLKLADQGKVQMSPEDRAMRVKFLIATVPGYAKHHGIDNRQVELIATDMVSQGMNTTQIVQTIADPEKMVGFAKVAKEKLAAKEAEAKAAAPADAAPEKKFTDTIKSRTQAGSQTAAVEAEQAAAAGQKNKR